MRLTRRGLFGVTVGALLAPFVRLARSRPDQVQHPWYILHERTGELFLVLDRKAIPAHWNCRCDLPEIGSHSDAGR